MKIAIFTDTYSPQVNGVARTFQRFIEFLTEQQIEYQLFVPEINEEDRFSNGIHRFSSLPFFLYPECRLAIPNVFHIRKQLESFQPDIIHIATPFNMGLTGLYYAKKLNIPVVGSYHTHFDRYLQYYDLNFLSKWIWSYMRWFHRSFLKTFVPSNETKQELLRHGMTNIEIWSRGVDCSLFKPTKEQQIRKQFHIKEPVILTYVGRLAPEKNLDVLMKVSHELPPQVKENVHWLIVGEGPMQDQLQSQAPQNMTFTGYRKGKELAKIYGESSLFIFPSTTETFGNVVLESLACGTPAIVAKAGGVQEIVTDGKTGIICSPGNVEEFSKAITSLVNNQARMKMMSYEARAYALTCSWESIFSNLVSEYESVLTVHRQTNYA